MKDSYIFYSSFDVALRELPDKSRLKVYDAISDYALRGIETDLNGMEKAIFVLIKTQIDRHNKRVEIGKKTSKKNKVNSELTQGYPQVNPKLTPSKPQVNSFQKEEVFPNEKERSKEKDNTLEEDNLKERKKEKDIYKNNNPGAGAYAYVEDENETQSHEDIMREYGLDVAVCYSLKDFLRHCYLNKHIVSNAKLSDIIFRLIERYGNDKKGMTESIERAIRGGYFDIRA